jgi:hypothetical protein
MAAHVVRLALFGVLNLTYLDRPVPGMCTVAETYQLVDAVVECPTRLTRGGHRHASDKTAEVQQNHKSTSTYGRKRSCGGGASIEKHQTSELP